MNTFPNLKKLSFLDNVKLYGGDFTPLKDLSELEELVLTNTTGDDITIKFDWKNQLQKLHTLVLAGRKNIFFSMNPLPKSLQGLNLSGCDILDHEFIHLRELPSLKAVSIAHCTSVTNRVLEILSKIPTIRDMNCLGCTSITSVGIAYLANLPELQKLDCSGIAKDDYTEHFNNMKNLEILSLCDSSITDKTLCNLHPPKLHTLHLSGNSKITKEGFSHLMRFAFSLTKVELVDCPQILRDGLPQENGRGINITDEIAR